MLHLLPVGTHGWRKFIRLRELTTHAHGAGLALQDARGLGCNPFTRRFRLHRALRVGDLLSRRKNKKEEG